MLSIISEYNDKYLNESKQLLEYINDLYEDTEYKVFYSKYRAIVYPSIINRMYVNFEYSLKELYICIFRFVEKNNHESLDMSKLKIHEFPGYILEEATIEKGNMILNLNDKVISHTTKNMSVETILELFSRLSLDKNKLLSKIEKIDFSEFDEVPYEKKRNVEGRIKYLIKHRNLVSHSFIDEYLDKEVIIQWIYFLGKIYQIVFSYAINKMIDTNSLKKIEVKQILKGRSVICFDNTEDLSIEKNSIICKKIDESFYFYKVDEIVSENKDLTSTKGNIKIGLSISSFGNSEINNSFNNFYLFI